jgi:hypothetical protein
MPPSDKATNSGEEQSNLGFAKRVSQNPWFQISLFIITILSIGITIFVSVISKEKRELVYAINPVRTTVVSSQQASALEIVYKGAQLGDVDINIAQVAIWNKGKQNIKPENILKPIVIRTNPPVRILEASISKYSRDVIGFKIDDTQESLAMGTVPVTWHILEHNDGASVQLIYLGSSEIALNVEGVIEGLNEIRPVDLGVKIMSPSEQIKSRQANQWISTGMLVFSALILIMAVFILIYDINRKQLKLREQIPNFGFPIAIIIMAIIMFPKAIWPPFGF